MKLEAASRLSAALEVTAFEANPSQVKRLTSDLEKSSGAKVLDLQIYEMHPLDMAVAVDSELGAYKLAYSYRYSKSEITVKHAPNIHGWLVTIKPH